MTEPFKCLTCTHVVMDESPSWKGETEGIQFYLCAECAPRYTGEANYDPEYRILGLRKVNGGVRLIGTVEDLTRFVNNHPAFPRPVHQEIQLIAVPVMKEPVNDSNQS